jgi:hypothetical protein
MNKIVRSRSAIQWRIKRSDVHGQTCNHCSDSACRRLVADNLFFSRLQYLNRVRMRVIFPATCHQQVV